MPQILLGAGSVSAGAAANWHTHRHRPGGCEEAELIQLRLEGAKIVKTIGVYPEGDCRALRLERGHAPTEFGAGGEGLSDRLAEIGLYIDEINQLQLDATMAGRSAAQLNFGFRFP